MCTHPILSKIIFQHHWSKFGAPYPRAHAARDFLIHLKKNIAKMTQISSNFEKNFFFQNSVSCALCTQIIKKNNFETYNTPKLLKINFYEICTSAEDYILKFWQKNPKISHFSATYFFKISYMARHDARGHKMFTEPPEYI